MASYQIRQRDPLLDQNMQAALERRGKELIGLALIVAATLTALMLGSYTAGDPSWMAATDGPAQNALGRFGATVASPLNIIAGRGAWGIALVLLAWGLRFVLHRGEERALNRVIFAPIAIALASVYASTLVPGADWGHSFGLGGLFGDTVLGAVLGVMPFGAAFGLKVMSLMMAAAVITMGLYVTGFDSREVRLIGQFLVLGLVLAYVVGLRLLGRTVTGGAGLARGMAKRRQTRRAEAATARNKIGLSPTPMVAPASPLRRLVEAREAQAPDRHSPAPLSAPTAASVPKASFLSRMPSLAKRAPDPQPELVEPAYQPQGWDENAPSDERIRARIANAIHAHEDALNARIRAEPPVTAPASGPLVAPIAAPLPARPSPPPPVEVSEDVPARFRLPRFGATNSHAEPRPDPPVTTAGVARRNDAPVSSAIRRAVGAVLATGPRAIRHTPAPEAPAAHDVAAYDMASDFDDAVPGYKAGLTEAAAFTPAPRAAFTLVPRAAVAAPGPRGVVQNAPRKPAQPSRQARAEAQPRLRFDEQPVAAYDHPPLSLLSNPAEISRHHLSNEALEENARMLETVLDDYGVKGEIVSVRPGPVVTMYELEPAPGLKASRVIGLADDIARSMSALAARVSTVPGRSVIGIELPNAQREKVVLREILADRTYGDTAMKLPLALGKDIGGSPIVANLSKMPHLLIAGTTGSGKSVAINTMILSLLYKLSPEECRLIMIDPKMLELSVYDGIPHLLSPVVTDPKKAVVALKWVVGEMEERYRKMSRMGVRNIEGFNGRVKEAQDKGELFKRTIQTGFDEDTGEPIFETEEFEPGSLPYIVVIVDEMADLMMVAGKEIEACIQRLAQMARASGIHLIMATQRPSVDVITGTIKANFPTRISFQVTSKIDSRTILGEQGAEQLLGMGDMLYMAGGSRVTRVHGPFVSDEEVEEIVNHLKSYGPPEYLSGVVDGPDDGKADDIDLVLGLGGNTDAEDVLYDQAVAVVLKDRKVSTSYIQRKLAIGYNKAARLVEQMEENGLVSAANHVGKREILVPEQ